MPLNSEEDEFVEVASAALPRIAEIIVAFPAEDRAGALEVAERRYLQAARDYGCTQAETERWVAAIMRKLRTRVEEKSMGQGNGQTCFVSRQFKVIAHSALPFADYETHQRRWLSQRGASSGCIFANREGLTAGH
jgi:hypothetical protein